MVKKLPLTICLAYQYLPLPRKTNLHPDRAVTIVHKIWSKLADNGLVCVYNYSAVTKIRVRQGWASMEVVVCYLNIL